MFDLPLESPAPVVDGSTDEPKTASIHQVMDPKSLKAHLDFFTKEPDVVISNPPVHTSYFLFSFVFFIKQGAPGYLKFVLIFFLKS